MKRGAFYDWRSIWCGYVIPMDIDIAYEVVRKKIDKGKSVLYGYCINCEHIMYLEGGLDKLEK